MCRSIARMRLSSCISTAGLSRAAQAMRSLLTAAFMRSGASSLPAAITALDRSDSAHILFNVPTVSRIYSPNSGLLSSIRAIASLLVRRSLTVSMTDQRPATGKCMDVKVYSNCPAVVLHTQDGEWSLDSSNGVFLFENIPFSHKAAPDIAPLFDIRIHGLVKKRLEFFRVIFALRSRAVKCGIAQRQTSTAWSTILL